MTERLLDRDDADTAHPAGEVTVFTLDEAVKAGNEWGANCGPGALAAILGRSLDAVRPALRGFDQKRYTNPAMMRGALRELGAEHVWKVIDLNDIGGWNWPTHGLCRVQWEGPWTKPGVPIAARYRHTHWIGARGGNQRTEIFDINCICVGGWVSLAEWSGHVVPWLLRECEPKADGGWHVTHVVEVVTSASPIPREGA